MAAPGQPITREDGKDLPSLRNTRYGLVLFAIYVVLYGGFVLLNVFAPSVMEVTPFAITARFGVMDIPSLSGINLAVLYGLGLIVAAFVLALFYGWLCRASRSANDEKEAR